MPWLRQGKSNIRMLAAEILIFDASCRFAGQLTSKRSVLASEILVHSPSCRFADPELEFYDRFGVRRATFLEALGPQVVFGARRRARAKGHENGPRDGDIWRMPGIFAVSDKKVVWAHQPKHAADHPDFAAIPSFVSAAR